MTSTLHIGGTFSLAALDSALMLKVICFKICLSRVQNIFLSITLSINVEPRAARENATPMRNVDVTKDKLSYTNIRPIASTAAYKSGSASRNLHHSRCTLSVRTVFVLCSRMLNHPNFTERREPRDERLILRSHSTYSLEAFLQGFTRSYQSRMLNEVHSEDGQVMVAFTKMRS